MLTAAHSSGTSDEHISLLEHLAPLHQRISAIVVTTPQAVALLDVMKCISFARTVSLPVLGLVENMSGFVCPCCGDVTNVFSSGGGEQLAEREGLRFLGRLPIDTELVAMLDGGVKEAVESDATALFPCLQRYKACPSSGIFKSITQAVKGSLGS